jgi:HEXXH motif-containing protein
VRPDPQRIMGERNSTTKHSVASGVLTALDDSEFAVRLLQPSRLSKHLLQLRLLRDMALANARPSAEHAGFRESYRTLAELQRVRPDLVGALLATPQIGAWSAWCLRRLITEPAPDAGRPHAVDLAHLGAIAAVVALRAHIDVTVTVPVRGSWIYLPTLGRVACGTASGEHTLTQATCHDGTVATAATEPVRPRRLRRLTASAGGVDHELLFDDVDPYRHLYRAPAAPDVPAEEFDRWQTAFDAAWKVLAERHRILAGAVRNGTSSVVPLAGGKRTTGLSASSRDAVGMLAMTEPPDGISMAVTLVHEMQHNRLNALHDVRELFEPGDRHLCYSPWRDDPRPVSGLLHGAVSFLAVADFWRAEHSIRPGDRVAEFDFALAAIQVQTAYRTLAKLPSGLTAAGREVVTSIGRNAERWREYPVAAPIRRLAADVADEHRIRWRLRHLRPRPATVADLGRAFAHGRPRPTVGGPGRIAGPAASPAADRRPLVESRLRRAVSRWVAGEHPPTTRDPMSTGYGALIAGEPVRASAAFAEALAADAEDPDNWAALLLARRGARGGAVSFDEPEIPYAVFRDLTDRPAPDVLLNWFDG